MEEKEIKEAMIEALTHLEGCKYFVATILKRLTILIYQVKNIRRVINLDFGTLGNMF